MIEFDKLLEDVANDIGTLEGRVMLLTKFGGNVNVGRLVVRLVGKLSMILLWFNNNTANNYIIRIEIKRYAVSIKLEINSSRVYKLFNHNLA